MPESAAVGLIERRCGNADGQQLRFNCSRPSPSHLPAMHWSESNWVAIDVESSESSESRSRPPLVFLPAYTAGKHVCPDLYALGRPQSARPRMGQRASFPFSPPTRLTSLTFSSGRRARATPERRPSRAAYSRSRQGSATSIPPRGTTTRKRRANPSSRAPSRPESRSQTSTSPPKVSALPPFSSLSPFN